MPCAHTKGGIGNTHGEKRARRRRQKRIDGSKTEFNQAFSAELKVALLPAPLIHALRGVVGCQNAVHVVLILCYIYPCSFAPKSNAGFMLSRSAIFPIGGTNVIFLSFGYIGCRKGKTKQELETEHGETIELAGIWRIGLQ